MSTKMSARCQMIQHCLSENLAAKKIWPFGGTLQFSNYLIVPFLEIVIGKHAILGSITEGGEDTQAIGVCQAQSHQVDPNEIFGACY